MRLNVNSILFNFIFLLLLILLNKSINCILFFLHLCSAYFLIFFRLHLGFYLNLLKLKIFLHFKYDFCDFYWTNTILTAFKKHTPYSIILEKPTIYFRIHKFEFYYLVKFSSIAAVDMISNSTIIIIILHERSHRSIIYPSKFMDSTSSKTSPSFNLPSFFEKRGVIPF